VPTSTNPNPSASNDETPAAFFSITLHTLELASPSAQSWSLPQTLYSAVPIAGNATYGDGVVVLNARTQQAAADGGPIAARIRHRRGLQLFIR